MKEKLKIQTREEFNREIINSWSCSEQQKLRKSQIIKKDIENLKQKINLKRTELKESKPLTLKEHKEHNTYEDWVNRIREDNKEDYDIIENKDSKEIMKNEYKQNKIFMQDHNKPNGVL